MASRYSALSSFNSKTSANIDTSNYSNWGVKNILLNQIYSNDKNFYEQEGIEEKAKEILSVGLIQHLVVKYAPSPEGAYELIDGERRWRALKLLVEQGHSKFESVTCRVVNVDNEHEEMIMLITANSSRQKSVSTLIKEAQTLKNELKYMRDNGLTLNGYDLNSGRLRDIVASIMNTSKTKIAEYEAVGNNLIEEFKDILDKNNITFSAAYQISKLRPEEQNELLETYKEQGELSYKYVIEYAKAKKEEHEKEQLPGQMAIDDIEKQEEDICKNSESVTTLTEPPEIDSSDDTEELCEDNHDDIEKDIDTTYYGNAEDCETDIQEEAVQCENDVENYIEDTDNKDIHSTEQHIVENVDRNQDVVHEAPKIIDDERKIRCARSLLDTERNYKKMMAYGQSNSSESAFYRVVKNTVNLEAYEHYINYLKKKIEEANDE